MEELKKEIFKSEWRLTVQQEHGRAAALTAAVKVLNSSKHIGGYADILELEDDKYTLRIRTTTHYPMSPAEHHAHIDRIMQDIVKDLRDFKKKKSLRIL